MDETLVSRSWISGFGLKRWFHGGGFQDLHRSATFKDLDFRVWVETWVSGDLDFRIWVETVV